MTETNSAFLIVFALAVLLLFACAVACVKDDDHDSGEGTSVGE